MASTARLACDWGDVSSLGVGFVVGLGCCALSGTFEWFNDEEGAEEAEECLSGLLAEEHPAKSSVSITRARAHNASNMVAFVLEALVPWLFRMVL
jgi:hypothetical protein